VQTLVCSGLSDSLEGLEVLHIVSDSHGTQSLHWALNRHKLAGNLGSLGNLFRCGISLLGFLRVQGEKDELALVFLQALSVLLQALNRFVSTSVVYGNTDGSGLLPVQAGGLNLLEAESTSNSLLDVVLESWARDNRSEATGGPGSDTGSLSMSVVSPPDFPGRLVKPSLDIPLPILMEMTIWN